MLTKRQFISALRLLLFHFPDFPEAITMKHSNSFFNISDPVLLLSFCLILTSKRDTRNSVSGHTVLREAQRQQDHVDILSARVQSRQHTWIGARSPRLTSGGTEWGVTRPSTGNDLVVLTPRQNALCVCPRSLGSHPVTPAQVL